MINLNLQTASCLFWDDHMVCAAKFRLFNRSLRIVSSSVQYLTPDQPPSAKVFKQIFKATGLKSDPLLTCVLFPNTLIKEISMPPLEEHLIGKALRYDLDQHIPFSSSQVAYGFTLQDMGVSDKAHLLLGVVKKDIYDSQVKFLKGISVKNPIMLIRESALAAYYLKASRLFKESYVLLIDLSYSDQFTINIVAYGQLRFSKTAAFAFPDNPVDFTEEVQKHILEEIENAIVYFQTIQSGVRPPCLYFHSARDVHSDIANELCKALDIRMIEVSHLVEFEYRILYGMAVIGFGQERGIALDNSLALKKKSTPASAKTLVPKLLWSIVLLLTIGLIYPMYLSYRISRTEQLNDQIVSSVKQAKSVQKKVQALSQKFSIVRQQELQAFSYLNVLEEINMALPPDTIISEIQLSSSGSFLMRGFSEKPDHLLSTIQGVHNLRQLQSLPVEDASGEQGALVPFVFKGYFSKDQGVQYGEQ